MNTRLRLFLTILAILCAGNIAWRVWTHWGLVTINATDQPLSEVIRSIEHQAHIRLATNAPADTKVTVHIHKVPLLHALDVLAAAANANWSLSYFAASDKPAIDLAISSYSSGDSPAGWKRYSLPPMRGMGFDVGTSDPRQDQWEIKPVTEAAIQSYLEQGSRAVSAQFWAPESWNPAITSAPKSGKVTAVLPKLAKAAHGASAEVFLLNKQQAFGAPTAGGEAGDTNRPARPPGGFGMPGGGMPSEEMRKAMEDRVVAQINKLPANKREQALADFEARKKFFAEMANLTPEEQKAKMLDGMEKFMNNSQKSAEMESQMMKRGAMGTADQRNDFNRQMLSFRSRSNP
jgi:hypothetical protein